MELEFQDKKLEKQCQNEKDLQRKHGSVQARVIVNRLNQLQAAESLDDVLKLPQLRLHQLSGNRQGEWAVDVKHPKRIVLVPLNGDARDPRTVTKIKIIEVVDYH